jgi:hypothetical protein
MPMMKGGARRIGIMLLPTLCTRPRRTYACAAAEFLNSWTPSQNRSISNRVCVVLKDDWSTDGLLKNLACKYDRKEEKKTIRIRYQWTYSPTLRLQMGGWLIFAIPQKMMVEYKILQLTNISVHVEQHNSEITRELNHEFPTWQK